MSNKCNFVYSNGEQCPNECMKNSNFCKKHKYYGKYKNNNIQDEPEIEVNQVYVPEEPSDIADTLHNRAFIYKCIKDYNTVHNTDVGPVLAEPPKPPTSSSSSGGGIMDYLPMVVMFLMPVLKQMGGTAEIMNIIKNLKGFKNDNIKNEPILQQPKPTPPEIPIIQTGINEVNISEHKK